MTTDGTRWLVVNRGVFRLTDPFTSEFWEKPLEHGESTEVFNTPALRMEQAWPSKWPWQRTLRATDLSLINPANVPAGDASDEQDHP